MDRRISPQQSRPTQSGMRFDLALGIERFGLWSLRAPVLTVLLALVLIAGAVAGISRIRIDDSLSQLFRADTPEFRQFEQVSRQFPSSEYDVLVVVEGKSLLARESIEKLRSLVTDLQLVNGARGIISLFSARQPSETGGSRRRCSRRSCRAARIMKS